MDPDPQNNIGGTTTEDSDFSDLIDKFAPGEAVGTWSEPDYGPRNERIPEKYQRTFKSMVTKFQLTDMFARIEEVKRAADGGFYWRNIFDAYWSDLQFTWLQGGGPGSTGVDNNATGLSYPLNIYQAQGRAYMKIVGHVPQLHFAAGGDTAEAFRIAEGANCLKEEIEAQNDVTELAQDFARIAWTSGRYGIYTRWVADGARFGYYDEDENDEAIEGVGRGKTPPKKKPRKPKGGVIMTMVDLPWLKPPIEARNQHEFAFLIYSDEIQLEIAKALYPHIAKKIQAGEPGPAEFIFDRTTRIALVQGLHLVSQMAEAVHELPTIQSVWIRPAMFASIADKEEREWFEDNYPDGARVVFVGTEYAESCNESMDDHWSIGHAVRGHGQATPAYGYSMLTMQDAFSDAFDLEMETHMRAIPAIWFDPSIFDLPAYSREQARPGAAYAMKHDIDPQINPQQHAFVEPQISVSAQLMGLRQWMTSDGSTAITGIAPAAMGQADESNTTLGGISILRAASRGEAGTSFMGFVTAYSRAIEQGVRIAAKYKIAEADSNGMLSVSRQGKPDTMVDLVALRMGRYWAEMDADQTYPATFEEQQLSLTALVLSAAQGDKLAQEQLANPANAEVLNKLRGIPYLRSLTAEVGAKVQQNVDLLLSEQPQPNTPVVQQYQQTALLAMAQGQPAPPPPTPYQLFLSSRKPSPLDNAVVEAQMYGNWVSSPKGQYIKTINESGFLNVELYALSLQTIAQQTVQQNAMNAMQPQIMLEKVKKMNPPKSPSESINFKDLGPSGKVQVGAQAGLDLTADAAVDTVDEAVAPPPQPRKLKR